MSAEEIQVVASEAIPVVEPAQVQAAASAQESEGKKKRKRKSKEDDPFVGLTVPELRKQLSGYEIKGVSRMPRECLIALLINSNKQKERSEKKKQKKEKKEPQAEESQAEQV
jgi:hypothetical protein